MYTGYRSAPLHPGQTLLIPRCRTRYIRNTGTGDFIFLCICNPEREGS
jgi:mannose-6-phosphate isomerase-like protein (cupin superfamily)